MESATNNIEVDDSEKPMLKISSRSHVVVPITDINNDKNSTINQTTRNRNTSIISYITLTLFGCFFITILIIIFIFNDFIAYQ